MCLCMPLGCDSALHGLCAFMQVVNWAVTVPCRCVCNWAVTAPCHESAGLFTWAVTAPSLTNPQGEVQEAIGRVLVVGCRGIRVRGIGG